MCCCVVCGCVLCCCCVRGMMCVCVLWGVCWVKWCVWCGCCDVWYGGEMCVWIRSDVKFWCVWWEVWWVKWRWKKSWRKYVVCVWRWSVCGMSVWWCMGWMRMGCVGRRLSNIWSVCARRGSTCDRVGMMNVWIIICCVVRWKMLWGCGWDCWVCVLRWRWRCCCMSRGRRRRRRIRIETVFRSRLSVFCCYIWGWVWVSVLDCFNMCCCLWILELLFYCWCWFGCF